MAAAEEEAAAEICEDCPKVGAASDRMMVSSSFVFRLFFFRLFQVFKRAVASLWKIPGSANEKKSPKVSLFTRTGFCP